MFLVAFGGDCAPRAVVWAALMPFGLFFALLCIARLDNWFYRRKGRLRGWWFE